MQKLTANSASIRKNRRERIGVAKNIKKGLEAGSKKALPQMFEGRGEL